MCPDEESLDDDSGLEQMRSLKGDDSAVTLPYSTISSQLPLFQGELAWRHFCEQLETRRFGVGARNGCGGKRGPGAGLNGLGVR